MKMKIIGLLDFNNLNNKDYYSYSINTELYFINLEEEDLLKLFNN